MSNINLKPEYLTVTRKILVGYMPEAEVWVYGSRVNGDSHEASDLDLVVRNPDDLTRPQKNIDELKNAFTESDLPILVGILDWARLPESFHERIVKCYEVVQKPVSVSKPETL
ncbi:MAG: nucleotidyltransferase domain-containing protein [bacterium]|nr:nucleotidyltransferase domain-containing protein [bacterium]